MTHSFVAKREFLLCADSISGRSVRDLLVWPSNWWLLQLFTQRDQRPAPWHSLSVCADPQLLPSVCFYIVCICGEREAPVTVESQQAMIYVMILRFFPDFRSSGGKSGVVQLTIYLDTLEATAAQELNSVESRVLFTPDCELEVISRASNFWPDYIPSLPVWETHNSVPNRIGGFNYWAECSTVL